MITIGFIGTGNMGSAVARAMAKSGVEARLLFANRSPEMAERLARELGGEAVDNREAVRRSDWLVIGVKPHLLAGMVQGIRDLLEHREKRQVIVSMVAGRDLNTLAKLLGEGPIIRIMPNIPLAVGGGVTMYDGSPEVTAEETALLERLLAASGLVSRLEEPLMEAATGVTGCGPAFAAMFVEALADGAVACGLPRAQALAFAAQMLKGSAQLLLETGEHPGSLKDRVCSPGGTTIQGVRKLEEGGFRAAVMNAVIATFEKEV